MERRALLSGGQRECWCSNASERSATFPAHPTLHRDTSPTHIHSLTHHSILTLACRMHAYIVHSHTSTRRLVSRPPHIITLIHTLITHPRHTTRRTRKVIVQYTLCSAALLSRLSHTLIRCSHHTHTLKEVRRGLRGDQGGRGGRGGQLAMCRVVYSSMLRSPATSARRGALRPRP